MSETQETWEKRRGQVGYDIVVPLPMGGNRIVAGLLTEADADLIVALHNERAGLELAQAGAKKLWSAHHALTAALAEKDNLAREVGSLIADLQVARSALEARGRAIDALVSERDSLASQLQAEREKAALLVTAMLWAEEMTKERGGTMAWYWAARQVTGVEEALKQARAALVTPTTEEGE